MRFEGVKMIDISGLRLSQIYLSQDKLNTVNSWFTPTLENFQPIPVRDFLNNGNLHMTDGHSRTFVAWQNGLKQIPCIYDEDEMVTCKLGQRLYENNIEWCERYSLQHISDLADRILSENDYDELWRGRCGKMHDLEVALTENKMCAEEFYKKKARLQEKTLFIYGISEDYTALYYENALGSLYEIPYSVV